MATIVKFNIPPNVNEQLDGKFNTVGIVDAVQAELNAGSVQKSNASSKAAWKSIKVNGTASLVIDVTSKTGEKLRLQNTIPAKFYAWCLANSNMQSFAATDTPIPEVFIKWFTAKFPVTK